MADDLKTIKTVDLSPFKCMVMTIGELPSSFVESMTYYEALAWLDNYIEKTLIPTINNNAEAVQELQALYIELHDYVENYFDNLDVQEEINNKLDAMAEAGTLQEIITSYIQANVAWTFDTVADMKLSENLIAGSYAQTLGFRSVNDGGEGLYKITDSGTANEKDIIAVGDLKAHLVYTKTLKPETFGAYGDGVHDDSGVIQYCLDLIQTGGELYLSHKYVLQNEIDISGYKNIKIVGNGNAILFKENGNYTNTFFGDGAENIKISNITFDGSRPQTLSYTWPHVMNAAIIFRYGKDNTLENCTIKNHWYGVCLSTSNGSCNTRVDKCNFNNCNTDIDLYGKPIVSITNNSSNGCTQNSIVIEPVGTAHEDIYNYENETDIDSLSVNNIITGNSITNCNGIAININSGSIDTIISNNIITNVKKGIYLYHLECKNIVVANNIISNVTELRGSENGRPYYSEGTGIAVCRNLYGVTLANNMIIHARTGIVVIGASGTLAKNYSIYGNHIEYCLTSGISLYYASQCVLSNNFFKNNCRGTDSLYWYQNGGIHLYQSSDIFCSSNFAVDTDNNVNKQSACVYIGEGSTDIGINNCSSLNTRYAPVYPNNANLKVSTATMTSPYTAIQNAG